MSSTPVIPQPGSAVSRPQRLGDGLLAAALTLLAALLIAVSASAHDFGETGIGGGPEAEPATPACGENECCDATTAPGTAPTPNSQSNGTTGCTSGGGNEKLSGTAKVADPVDAFTGRFRYVHVDLELSGVLPIRMVRRYDSQSRYDSPLGYGWSFDYDLRLFEYVDPADPNNKSVIVRGPWGQREHFSWTGTSYDDHQDKARGRAGTLEVVTGGYEYRYPNGHIAFFDDEGVLTRLYDPQKNYLQFTYEGTPPARQDLRGISPYSPNQTQPGLVARVYRITEIREYLSDATDTGRFVTLAYDAEGRLDSVESFEVTNVPAGIIKRRVQYEHDEVYANPNPTPTFRGNLTRVTDAEGIEYTYLYEDPQDIHNLTFVRQGQATAPLENQYDANDRVEMQWVGRGDTDEREWTIAYGDPDPTTGERITTISRRILDETGQNPRLAVSTLRFNPTGHVIQSVDALGHRTTFDRTTMAGVPTEPPQKITITVERNTNTVQSPIYETYRVVTQTYDTSQNRTSRAVTTTFAPSDEETVTETWTYDNDWVKTYQRETTCTSSCPGAGVFLTTYDFFLGADSRPTNIQKITRRIDGSSNEETSFEYDPVSGQLTKVLLPDVGSESIDLVRTYHSTPPHTGLLHTIEVDDGDPAEHLKRNFAYDAQAQLTTVTDARGNPTKFDFDNLGRLVSVTRQYYDETTPLIVTADTTTVFSYTGPNDDLDPNTQLDNSVNWKPGRHLTRVEVGNTTAGDGKVRYMIYDPRGRLAKVLRKDPAGPSFPELASFSYDSDDNRVRAIDGKSHPTTFAYDLMAQLVSVTDPATHATAFDYDPFGNRTLVRDAKNRDTLFTYDALSRLVEVNVDATGSNPLALTTEFRYDAAGNVRTVEDPKAQVTAYEYDGLSRLKSVTQPLGVSTPADPDDFVVRYDYDERSRLTKVTNARADELVYSYFPWGGLESVLHDADGEGDPDPTERLVSYTYDLSGNVLTTTDTQIQPGSLYTFTYDPQDRVDSVTAHYVLGSTDPVLDSRYDAIGNRAALDAADITGAFYHEWRFDAFNRLKDAVLPGGADPTIAFAYDARDDVTSITRKDSTPDDYLKTTFTWFAEGPLDTITVEDLLPSTTQQLLLDYASPDATLNVVGMSETRGAGGAEPYSYAYDGADRLTQAQSPIAFGLPAQQDFDYDDAGNRGDPAAPADYDYDVNNRILASPGLTYAFDADGNLETLSDDATPTPNLVASLTWDFTNRLQTYTEAASGKIATYRYDPFGRRIQKTVDPDGAGGSTAETTWYLWDGDRLLGEYADVSGSRQVRYAYAGGFAPIQVAYDNGSGEDIYDVHTDHLDTPRLLTDASGSPAWQSSHEAYGAAQITNTLGSGRDFNIRFPGQYYDVETGLHYNRFRYYDPAIGRYISADPIGQSGGGNIYSYALGSPVVLSDPSGEHPVAIGIGAACLGAGLWAAIDSQNDAAELAADAAATNERIKALSEFAEEFDELARCATDPRVKDFYEQVAAETRRQADQEAEDLARRKAQGSAEGFVNSMVEGAATLCIGAAVRIGVILSGG